LHKIYAYEEIYICMYMLGIVPVGLRRTDATEGRRSPGTDILRKGNLAGFLLAAQTEDSEADLGTFFLGKDATGHREPSPYWGVSEDW
jgi:hypothetical protein